METDMADAPSRPTGDDDTDDAATSSDAAGGANDGNNKRAGATSEDFVIFGARPSHLFDDIAVTVDSLLAEQVASLPLLPRTLTQSERQRAEQSKEEGNNKPRTGEEILMEKLRKAYRRNLDLAEAYCSRNVFTVQYHTKTKRRKILENYLARDNERDGADGGGKSNEEPAPLPAITFNPPDGELPSPDQIVGMDREILVARQRLRQAKRRRIQLRRQSDRLAEASRTLTGLREALKDGLEGEGGGGAALNAASVQKLRESVTNAMEGHEELDGWNSRAEEMSKILDGIKAEREAADGPRGKASDGNETSVVGRERDERERKRMQADVVAGSGSHGSLRHVASLLKKIRGN